MVALAVRMGTSHCVPVTCQYSSSRAPTALPASKKRRPLCTTYVNTTVRVASCAPGTQIRNRRVPPCRFSSCRSALPSPSVADWKSTSSRTRLFFAVVCWSDSTRSMPFHDPVKCGRMVSRTTKSPFRRTTMSASKRSRTSDRCAASRLALPTNAASVARASRAARRPRRVAIRTPRPGPRARPGSPARRTPEPGSRRRWR